MKLDLGKLKFTWRGPYSSSSTYEKDDVVYYKGSSYIYVSSGKTTGISPSNRKDNTTWNVMCMGEMATDHVSKLPDVAGYKSGGVILPDGTIKTWGSNDYSNQGNGWLNSKLVTYDVKKPKYVIFPDSRLKVVQWVRSGLSNWALMDNGRVYSWGEDTFGQLGVGGKYVSHESVVSSPTEVIFDTNITIKSISVGASNEASDKAKLHALFVTTGGDIYACGYNGLGQCGTGSVEDKILTPKKINSSEKFNKAYAVGEHMGRSFAITKNGKLFAWGYNGSNNLKYCTLGVPYNDTGVRVIVSNVTVCHPIISPTLVQFKENNVVNTASCTSVSSTYVVALESDGLLSGIPSGSGHTLMMLSDGSFWSCGDNTYGQLGINKSDIKYVSLPNKINTITNSIKTVYAAGKAKGYSLVETEDNEVYVFGNNDNVRLGISTADNSSQHSPKSVPNVKDNQGIKKILDFGTSDNHSTAILFNSGVVLVCGFNDRFSLKLGIGDRSDFSLFKKMLLTGGKAVDIAIVGMQDLAALGVLVENGSYFQTGKNEVYQKTEGAEIDKLASNIDI